MASIHHSNSELPLFPISIVGNGLVSSDINPAVNEPDPPDNCCVVEVAALAEILADALNLIGCVGATARILIKAPAPLTLPVVVNPYVTVLVGVPVVLETGIEVIICLWSLPLVTATAAREVIVPNVTLVAVHVIELEFIPSLF